MLVTDRRRCRGRDLVALAAQAARGGVGIVLLRERDLPEAAFTGMAERMAGALPPGTLLSIHTRTDVARGLHAGLHLAEEGPPPPEGILWHGRSVHAPGAARRARRQGAAYLVAGTVFPTPGKPGAAGTGPGGLQAMVAAAEAVPVFAIGGIEAGRVAEVRAAGAYGVAVVGAILEAEDPLAAARALALALH